MPATHAAPRPLPVPLAPAERWSRRLLARIDIALELGSGTPRESVGQAWRGAVREEPQLRRLLDDASLGTTRRTLLASVAVAGGVASFDTPPAAAVALGEELLRSFAA